MMFNSFAQRIGADIRTLGRSFDDKNAKLDSAAQLWLIAPEQAQLLMVGTTIQPSENISEETPTLEEWIGKGGTLVLAPSYKYPDLAEPLIWKTGFTLKTSGIINLELRLFRSPH